MITRQKKYDEIRNHAASLIQHKWRSRQAARLLDSTRRIQELEEVISKLIELDVTNQIQNLTHELDQKITLNTVLERRNGELVDKIASLEQHIVHLEKQRNSNINDSATNLSKKDTNEEKRLRHQYDKLIADNKKLEQKLELKSRDVNQIQQSFVECNLKNKHLTTVVNQLQQSIQKTEKLCKKLTSENKLMKLAKRNHLDSQTQLFKLEASHAAEVVCYNCHFKQDFYSVLFV